MPMNHFNSMFGTCGRNFKRALLTVAIACASFAAFFASADNTHLIVHFKDGSKTSFVLADKPAVSRYRGEILLRRRDFVNP